MEVLRRSYLDGWAGLLDVDILDSGKGWNCMAGFDMAWLLQGKICRLQIFLAWTMKPYLAYRSSSSAFRSLSASMATITLGTWNNPSSALLDPPLLVPRDHYFISHPRSIPTFLLIIVPNTKSHSPSKTPYLRTPHLRPEFRPKTQIQTRLALTSLFCSELCQVSNLEGQCGAESGHTVQCY